MDDMHGMAKQQVLQNLIDTMNKMGADKMKGPSVMKLDMTALPADAHKPDDEAKPDLMAMLKDPKDSEDQSDEHNLQPIEDPSLKDPHSEILGQDDDKQEHEGPSEDDIEALLKAYEAIKG